MYYLYSNINVVKLAKSPKSFVITKSNWFKRDRVPIPPTNIYSRLHWFYALPNLFYSDIKKGEYFRFCLTKNANIFIVEHITDIIPYCVMDDLRECLIERGYINKENYRIEKDCWATTIDFDKMKEDGYDGMFVYHDGTELYDHTILEEWET